MISDRKIERWFVEIEQIGMESTPWWSVYQAESLADGLTYIRHIRLMSINDPPQFRQVYRLHDRESGRIVM